MHTLFLHSFPEHLLLATIKGKPLVWFSTAALLERARYFGGFLSEIYCLELKTKLKNNPDKIQHADPNAF